MNRRPLDTSWHNLAIELLRAVSGLLAAFVVSEAATSWVGWRGSLLGAVATGAIFLPLALGALFVTSARPIQRALLQQRRAIEDQESVLRATANRHQFAADLQNALDMADGESEALDVAVRAIKAVHPGPAQLLLADSSRAHLRPAASTDDTWAGCSVLAPWSCPAVRRGMTLEFESSSDLAACPRLAGRGGELSAVCVPVTILGTPMGVLHATAPVGQLPMSSERNDLETVAIQIGARVGVMRAMDANQLAATTDPLTGRLNRRTMEDRLREMHLDGLEYAVVFADLDRFKVLNDTHGHAAGDKALTHFARVISGVVRDQDLVCRYGGEEFVIVFPQCRVAQAVPVVHRMREELARTISAAGVAQLTASYGVADSTYAEAPSDVIAHADAALLVAKRSGRDRVAIADVPDAPGAPGPGGVRELATAAGVHRLDGTADVA